MVLDAFADLNWLAVLVAGLAYFVLGAVWYTDILMGRQYRTALGLDPAAKQSSDPMPLVINLIGWLVSALALALVTVAVGAQGAREGAMPCSKSTSRTW